MLLSAVLRRALRKAGLPELRFHALRHLAASLMVKASVSVNRAQEILGLASERTTLAVYTQTLRRQHDDAADLVAASAGLTPKVTGTIGNKSMMLSREHSRNYLN